MNDSPRQTKKILYVASTASHLTRFHQPYMQALSEKYRVFTMANGEEVDYSIPFDKHFFSFTNLRCISKIRKIIKKEKFDVILLHTSLAAFLVRAALPANPQRRPYVLNVVHGYLFQKKLRSLKDRILLFCEKLMRKKTDDIAVMNQDDLEIATQNRLCRGQVLMTYGMGVPLKAEQARHDEDLRTRFVRKPTDFVCTFVGELSKRKNQIFLIRCAAILREQGIPIRLLLIGEGGERATLEKEIDDRKLGNTVFLLGSQDCVADYLGITDLYVSASISEGLPFNVMEAMACGLPIVASDTKGQSDLLADTSDALYPLDDEDAFCDAVRQVYAKRRFGLNAKSYPNLEKYRLSAVFEDNLQLFTKGLR